MRIKSLAPVKRSAAHHNDAAESRAAYRIGVPGGREELELFTGDGDMASRLRAFDWGGHPLGAPASWPAELKVVLGLCLNSSLPTAIYWGRDFRLIYNDAWSAIPAERHPAAIGRRAEDVWSDIWDVVGPQFREAVENRKGFTTFDQMLRMQRHGGVEDTYWNYSLSPIIGPDGEVLGLLNQGHETTDRVVSERGKTFLLALGDELRDLPSGEADPTRALDTVLGALGRHLGVARVGYALIASDGVTCRVIGNWRDGEAADMAAQDYTLTDYGPRIYDNLMAGRPDASRDVATEPGFSDETRTSFEAIGVRANLVVPVVRNGRSIALLFVNDDHPRRWSEAEIVLAREAADRTWHALDRAEAAARLRSSEKRFAAIFGQAAVGMSEVDQSGRFIRFNESMGRILGRSIDEARGLTVGDVTHPDDVATTRERLFGAIDSNEPYELEKRYLRPDGSVVWAVTHVTRLIDEAGGESGFFSVTTDITEKKEQERIRAWLIAELNHRVKNNLSTVQALARQTTLSTSTPEEFGAVFNARLMALSRAHDLLMRETWTSAALGDLVNDTLAPFQLDDVARINVGGPEVRLSPTAAVTMTLAFHELATNAAKFGALSRPEGRVSVEWTVDPGQNGGAIDLYWREAGGPIVVPPERRGFGSRLIERGAARELGGSVRLDFEPEGVACAFHLPLSQKIMVP